MRCSVTCALVLFSMHAACTRSVSRAQLSSGPSTPVVQTVPVVRAKLDMVLRLPGELRAYQEVSVFPKVVGFLKSIQVDRGSHVRLDDEMAELEAPELVSMRAEARARLRAGRAQLAAMRARLAADEGTYQRLRDASQTEGVVAGNDLALAERAVEADRAQLRAQQDSVSAAWRALQAQAVTEGYLRVRAPFDGVVTERNVHPGALVGPTAAVQGIPMFRIAMLARLRLDVPIPEAYAAGVPQGTRVEFTVPTFPGRAFVGIIARVSHAVDVKTRTMPVELDVANPDEELAPGTFAEVHWPVRRTHATLFVPASAVATTLEKVFVVRIREGKTEWVDVKTGATSNDMVEVFGDLREGDAVAKRGSDELRPGTAVTIQAQDAGGGPTSEM